MAGLFVIGVGNVGARVGKGMPRHKDVATAQEPRKLLARTRKAPPIDGAGEREDVASTRPSCTRRPQGRGGATGRAPMEGRRMPDLASPLKAAADGYSVNRLARLRRCLL